MARNRFNGNKDGSGFDKHPENINRKGRPKKLLSHINEQLKKEGYENVSSSQLKECYELLLNLPISKIFEIAGKKVILNAEELKLNPNAPILLSSNEDDYPYSLRLVASSLLSKNGFMYMQQILDRTYGYPQKSVDVQSTELIVHEVELPKFNEENER